MMASRVCNRPTLPATCLPCPSGPRCARRRAMSSSRVTSIGLAETTPAIPHMLIPCRAAVFDRHGVRNALTRAVGGDSRSERIDHRLNQGPLELERGLVHHQARTDVADVLDRNQPVGLERAAGGDGSTMTADSPTSGASSIDPYSLMRSMCTPLLAKWSRAALTYLVATRMRAPCFTVPA